MADHKKQHYVPRFLLRKFTDNPKFIAMCLLADGRLIRTAQLYTQCQKPFFYGEDGTLEASFAATEGAAATMLADLIPERLNALGEEDRYQLRQFVHYQRARTSAAADDVNRTIDGLAKELFSSRNPVTGKPLVPDADLSLFTVSSQNPQLEALDRASKSTPLLLDLEVAFLMRSRPPGFLISDDPVVFYNQWAEHHPVFWPFKSNTGLATKGLQMFMPISPRACLAVFDPSTYDYKTTGRTREIAEKDVHALNCLQALNAETSVYFHAGWTTEETVQQLRTARLAYKNLRQPSFETGKLYPKENGEHGQLLIYRPPSLQAGLRFVFASVIERRDFRGYDRPYVPIRSAELIALTEAYSRTVDKRPSPFKPKKKKPQ